MPAGRKQKLAAPILAPVAAGGHSSRGRERDQDGGGGWKQLVQVPSCVTRVPAPQAIEIRRGQREREGRRYREIEGRGIGVSVGLVVGCVQASCWFHLGVDGRRGC